MITEGKGDAVIDIDGSHLYKKYKLMVDAGEEVSLLGPRQQPPQGWISLPLNGTDTESSSSPIASLPSVTAGM